MSQQISVKIMLIKYGKLLLQNTDEQWSLIRGEISTEEALPQGLIREAKQACGWEINNIRLLRMNVYDDTELTQISDKFELVFIVDAVKKLVTEDEKPFRSLKWFPLSHLPKREFIDREDYESITALNELILKGKTIELESLPPVFDLKKQKSTKAIDLLGLPS